MYLGPQMAKIRVDNRKGVNFNTGPYGDPPLKIKILKIGVLHAREDQQIGPETKFMHIGPQYLTKKIGIFHVLCWPKLGLEKKMS